MESKATFEVGSTNEEDDVTKFEKLLDKLMKEGKIDKSDLFRKLGLRSNEIAHNSSANILEERESN